MINGVEGTYWDSREIKEKAICTTKFLQTPDIKIETVKMKEPSPSTTW